MDAHDRIVSECRPGGANEEMTANRTFLPFCPLFVVRRTARPGRHGPGGLLPLIVSGTKPRSCQGYFAPALRLLLTQIVVESKEWKTLVNATSYYYYYY